MPVMAITERTERVSVPDGDMDLFTWVPESGSGPGILLLQEIFGVGVYLRGVADRLARMGYVVGAPDVFWRIEPNYVADHTPEGLERSIGMMPKFLPRFGEGVADCIMALGRIAELPEVDGRGVGVLGFCLGGSLAWMVAANANPACCVSYYGSGVHQARDLARQITCPTLLHFGNRDEYIPNEQVDDIRAVIAGHDNFSLHVWDAGHAFDNFDAPMFYDEAAATAAWQVTSEFLATHLPAW